MKTTFSALVNDGEKNKANERMARFAATHGIDVMVGHNANWCEKEEDYYEGIAVNDQLVKALHLLGAALDFNVAEVRVETPVVTSVQITSGGLTYEGLMVEENLETSLGVATDVWLSFNELLQSVKNH